MSLRIARDCHELTEVLQRALVWFGTRWIQWVILAALFQASSLCGNLAPIVWGRGFQQGGCLTGSLQPLRPVQVNARRAVPARRTPPAPVWASLPRIPEVADGIDQRWSALSDVDVLWDGNWSVLFLDQISGGSTERHGIAESLLSSDGRLLLELREVTFVADAEGLVSATGTFRNVSNKVVTALGMLRVTTFENGMEVPFRQVIFTELHPDYRLFEPSARIRPGEKKEFVLSGPLRIGRGIPVRSVRVRVELVEFEDGSFAGTTDSKVYASVPRKRMGARLYKDWLSAVYKSNGGGLKAVAERVKGDELPRDQNFVDPDLRFGAQLYRSFIRDQIQKFGMTALSRIFSQSHDHDR